MASELSRVLSLVQIQAWYRSAIARALKACCQDEFWRFDGPLQGGPSLLLDARLFAATGCGDTSALKHSAQAVALVVSVELFVATRGYWTVTITDRADGPPAAAGTTLGCEMRTVWVQSANWCVKATLERKIFCNTPEYYGVFQQAQLLMHRLRQTAPVAAPRHAVVALRNTVLL